MECKTARELVDLVYPNLDELDGAEDEALHAHLNQCPRCASFAKWEDRIAKQMRDVDVPAGLQLRIFAKLRSQRRTWRKWIVRVASSAAVLALLFLFIWYQWLRPKPWIDSEEIAIAANKQLAQKKTDVEAAFMREFNVDIEAPADFNYHNLFRYGMKRLQGHLVPQLTFLHRGDGDFRAAVAEVYVLSKHQFDLIKTRELRLTEGSEQPSVRVLGDNDNPRFLYIVIFTGRSLEPFKKPIDATH